ncbi:copper homeostasis protein CutC [Bacillus sp. AFS015802]|uniref:copper homeostasis protein CutC n=1 Tax=Bacillus sp. AFS015802 TaxID=2033486 RepID=UPI000BF348ED|nr:copper homeostasis protein CutC [Bacillus sp. AFS015802]PFA64019.1 copper homeostasis protein CutC [Bacillus sp. AFS015802]
MSKLEVIVLNEEDARVAEASGADRLELVSVIQEGGLTPSYQMIERVIEAVSVPVQVMLRPHSKSFSYGRTGLMEMMNQLETFHQIGVQGIVFGALTVDGELDQDALRKVVKAAGKQSVTFHRAIDASNDPVALYKTLCRTDLKIDRVLTSGGQESVSEGVGIIKKMQDVEAVSGPVIMPGSGLTLENIEGIHRTLHAKEYHFGSGVRMNGSYESGIDPVKVKAVKEKIMR